MSDGLGGLFEGWVAAWLRKQGIDESRTPLSSSVGKMAGVWLGTGFILTVMWTIFGLF